MPDVEQETAFVEAFILPARRERYKLLLGNSRRRAKFLNRLNHGFDFVSSRAQPIPGNRHNAEDIARLLNQRGVKDTDTVYVFSDVHELDGRHLPLRQALEEVLQAGSGSVVCCVSGKLAYYRPEAPESGYILEKR